jgi:hypothetical protein
MDLKNLKILRFISDTNLCLESHNDLFYNTFKSAFNASQKTGHTEFLKIALGHGAIPDSMENFVVPEKIQDYIVFGGDIIVQYFHTKIKEIIRQLCTIKDHEIIELLEMIVCASGSLMMSTNYFNQTWDLIQETWHIKSTKRIYILLQKIFDDYDALWSGRYLDNNDGEYESIIELKHRLSAKTQIIMNRRNERKIEIENVISTLPICCTDIIYKYDDLYPKLNVIDWSKY